MTATTNTAVYPAANTAVFTAPDAEILSEITYGIPQGIPKRYLAGGGTPLFNAYGCALLERNTGKSFVYRAVNLNNGRAVNVAHKTTAITAANVRRVLELIRDSEVSGAGRLQADRPVREQAGIKKLGEIMGAVFGDFLPQHGYAVREQQIELAWEMLQNIERRGILLAEAEVGSGKTFAYLVAALLAKRGRMNDFWNMGYYPKMPYADMAYMPIVVSTSSIALQNAIVNTYIPELSRILMAHGVIRTPLTAVLRKGKEHYACDKALQAHYGFEEDPQVRQKLGELLKPGAPIDLQKVEGLSPYVKQLIRVPHKCPRHCPCKDGCRYNRFMQGAQSQRIDMQVCNHNYFLADARRRAANQAPLIPNYQTVIIDEAHKLLQAARSMYGVEFANTFIPEIVSGVRALSFESKTQQREARVLAKKLSDESKRLFKALRPESGDCCGDGEVEKRGEEVDCGGDGDDESKTSRSVAIENDAARHIRNIRNIAKELQASICAAAVGENKESLRAKIEWELNSLRENADTLAKREGNICWLEDGSTLCAVPKDIDARLYKDVWSRGIPTVLTSGTLAVGGDFSRLKSTLGLNKAWRVSTTCKASPFNHKENALLYISNKVPYPDDGSPEYVAAVSDEVERLVRASHGHAAVLFTSYNVLGLVHAELGKRALPYPLIKAERGNNLAIDAFKRGGNGILLASGSLWEGVDIPGDALSMLIIVRLPFAVPDPISEYEQTLYSDFAEYKQCVVVPDMQLKTKQGGGRLLRTVDDTGVIAVLDIRADENGNHHDSLIAAMPAMNVTSDIAVVERFYIDKKDASYFDEYKGGKGDGKTRGAKRT